MVSDAQSSAATFIVVHAEGDAEPNVQAVPIKFAQGIRSPAVVRLDDTPISQRLWNYAELTIPSFGSSAARSIVLGRPKSEDRPIPMFAFDANDFRADSPPGASPIHAFGEGELDGGRAYWTDHDKLWRFGPEDSYALPIATLPARGLVQMDRGSVLLIDATCWQATDPFAPFQPLRMNVEKFPRPDLHNGHRSAVYGQLLKASDQKWTLYSIELE
jgi:hypothetical protein